MTALIAACSFALGAVCGAAIIALTVRVMLKLGLIRDFKREADFARRIEDCEGTLVAFKVELEQMRMNMGGAGQFPPTVPGMDQEIHGEMPQLSR